MKTYHSGSIPISSTIMSDDEGYNDISEVDDDDIRKNGYFFQS
jgi:hypothetical protein